VVIESENELPEIQSTSGVQEVELSEGWQRTIALCGMCEMDRGLMCVFGQLSPLAPNINAYRHILGVVSNF